MNLTEDEQLLVYRLRRKRRMWLDFGRWVMLVIGILAGWRTIHAINIFFTAQGVSDFERMSARLAIDVWIVATVLLIGFTIKHWRGNPFLIVLLKLIDHCSQDNQPPKN